MYPDRKTKNLRDQHNKKSQKVVIITRCLCDPCPIFYTDSLSESILIQCKARHKHRFSLEKTKEAIRPPSEQVLPCHNSSRAQRND